MRLMRWKKRSWQIWRTGRSFLRSLSSLMALYKEQNPHDLTYRGGFTDFCKPLVLPAANFAHIWGGDSI